LGRTVLCGLAGLLLYLVLPTVWAVNGGGEHSFWEVLQTNLLTQKLYLIDQRFNRNRALLLGLTSVLPVILMGIRWRTHEGDTNAAAGMLTNAAFRIIHLFFLGACLWIAFDPAYSPRALGMNLSYLTFYFLGALAIGYYSGYALLVFTEVARRGRTSESALGKLLNPVVRIAMVAAAVLVPLGLIYKNYARVHAENGAVLKAFAARLVASLPPAPAYLLSDDPYALSVVQAHLGGAGKESEYIFVNTGSLEQSAYHKKLRQRYGEKWPAIGPDQEEDESGAKVPQPEIQAAVHSLTASNVVVYLHPSFGYFFEAVYPQPNGESYRLQPFKPEQYFAPPLSAEQVAANESYWKNSAEYISRIKELQEKKSLDAGWVARYYSRAFNTWGVEMQRSGKGTGAGPFFAEAYQLNSNNIPARVNHEFNQALEAGSRTERLSGKTLEERFGPYRTWDRVLADNGPFEHPDFCEPFGMNLLGQGQYRQAALQFSRVLQYQPTNFVSRIGFTKSLIGGNWLDEATAQLDRLEKVENLTEAQKVDIAMTRATAYFGRRDYAKAEETLKIARAAMPNQTALGESMFEFYRQTGNLTNALAVINEQLAKTPTNVVIHLQKAELLLSANNLKAAHETLDRVLTMAPKNAPAHLFHAFAYMQEGEHDKALNVLERLLREDSDHQQGLLYKGIAHFQKNELEPARKAFDAILNQNPDHQLALRNRAVLHLRAKRWSEAKEDYQRLRRLSPRSHSVLYGLAEVAAEEGKNAEAIRYYESYLKYAPEDGGAELEEEKKRVRERMGQLRNPK
ncbi:MAG: tetratricopeptide repeat protein, partial [Limisphaerales bacterium]